MVRANRRGQDVLYTEEYLLSNKAPKLSCSVDRVPFPQDELQFVCLRASFAMLKDLPRVKIVGDKIG